MSNDELSRGQPISRSLPSQEDLDKRLLGHSTKAEHIRGIKRTDVPARLYSYDVSQWPRTSSGELIPQINWGGLSVDLSTANLQFLVAGVPGTGKTMSFRALIESVFAKSMRKSLHGTDRAIIYDPQQSFLPLLLGMGVPEQSIIPLNPFDRRSYGWDLAADFTDSASAVQLAKSIIPCGENLSQPFFAKASAAVLCAVICEFIRSHPGKWDLADVIFTCSSEDSLLAFLRNSQTNPYTLAGVNAFSKGETRASVLAELTTNLGEFIALSACWRRARQLSRSYSVRQFMASDSHVAVLGANRQYSECLSAMNRLFLKRFSELSLDNPDNTLWEAGNRTWLVLDELKMLGKIVDLGDFISQGRQKGVCSVLGFQDFPALKSAFGEEHAHEITSCCYYKLFLRLSGESAKWACSTIGQTEMLDISVSVRSGSSVSSSFSEGQSHTRGTSHPTFGGGSGKWDAPFRFDSESRTTQSGTSFTSSSSHDVSIQRKAEIKDAVLDSEISGLPLFKDGGGITGFVVDYCRETQKSLVRRHHFPIDQMRFLGRPNTIPGFEPWKHGELEW
jgi:hypothetical protein